MAGITGQLHYTHGLMDRGQGDVSLALGALREIVTKGPRHGRGSETTQHASRALLEHYRWAVDCEREDEAPLKELAAILGSNAAALAWMKAKLPELEAKVIAERQSVEAATEAVRQLEARVVQDGERRDEEGSPG